VRLTPERRAHIAGVYALGTLRGPARAWVERRLRHDAVLCGEITGWQDQLARWVERLAPMAPREEVWLVLERRLVAPLAMPVAVAPIAVAPLPVGPEAVDPDAPTVIAPGRAPPVMAPRARDPLAFWRRTASVALAAALALAIGLGLLLMPAPTPTHTAVFADAQGRPVWIIDARLPEGVLGIRALPLAAPPPGRSYELWLLPSGGAPISLGLLPASGSADLVLGTDLPNRLLTAAGMAVSLEPAGGSPTGQPTGPVVFQAVLIRTAG